MDKFVKIGFGALAVFALIFGFMRLSQNLKLTFSDDGGGPAAVDDALEETKLRVMDTDEDGLNDWDELNTYGTSPYLADSDSDGVKDLDEIKKGADPNCPVGKECGSSDIIKAKLKQTITPAEPSLAAPEAADSELPVEELKQLSPTDIRDLLKQGGVTDEQLQGVSDEELKQLLEETLKQQ
ncbi:MAG: hypothetical protein A3H70_00300 [Candidatus Komeilibacteria bacterium RIFCSPLOWO2_02_FULL_48_11]|uniref:Uncharacterized protein n=1 Tax=Candidatus Komeilibacteria bacterium RIFCSPLOWO2_02_FULL_48_11 TaxID=1798553 RepID=A0A1G2BVL8_9BACT|nr:MAG: hypothetical protein A3H70_00300 [Candidatus Komeilibacteria bacterium RIFCSPLOWO2_02_FULL_48_11]